MALKRLMILLLAGWMPVALAAEDAGWLSTQWHDLMGGLGELPSQLDQALATTLFHLGDTAVTSYGLLRVALIVALSALVSRLVRRALTRLTSQRFALHQATLYTLTRVLHYLIMVIGLMVALSSIGLNFSNLALVAGALSVGIGFGLQSIVNNFVSGLILLFERTVKVGDFIELDSGVTGIVKEINVRSTLINTNDNVDIIVPNGELIAGRVTNWTLRETIRRVHVPFGVAYGSDKELVKKAVLEAAAAVSHTLADEPHHEPQVWLVGFGDSSLDFELVVWVRSESVKRPGAVQAAYLWEIESAFRKYGIEIPFPQRDLHLRSAFGGQETQALRGAFEHPDA